MLSGSRDVLCVCLCGNLSGCWWRLLFFFLLNGACAELEEEFLYLEIFES